MGAWRGPGRRYVSVRLLGFVVLASNAVALSCFTTPEEQQPSYFLLATVYNDADGTLATGEPVPEAGYVAMESEWSGYGPGYSLADASLDQLIAAPCTETCQRLDGQPLDSCTPISTTTPPGMNDPVPGTTRYWIHCAFESVPAKHSCLPQDQSSY